jgi:hypothetical protein
MIPVAPSQLGDERSMEGHMIHMVRLGIALATSLVLLGCGSQPPTSTQPSSLVSDVSAGQASPASAAVPSASATHAQILTAVIGAGSGIVNVTPTAAIEGSFSAQITVTVHGGPPDTTFYVQRAPEIGRSNGADGICQRASGEPPWGPPTPNFVTFPLPAAGPLIALRTSAGGAGSVHLDFSAPTIVDGTAFDVMFRLVDDLSSPTNELRTGCFTVAVK